MKILYTSTDMHSAIKKVLGKPEPNERRVAIVAYIGKAAKNFIPYPKDLELVCALQPGATCPAALDNLIKRGANIKKSARLHMKVYWSNIKGCVIGSANISGNALGRNGLKEAGVYFPPGVVDINLLLEEADPSVITDLDFKNLRKSTDEIDVINISNRMYDKSKGTRKSFLEWYESSGRTDWKIGWWSDSELVFSKAAKTVASKMYGCKEPEDFIHFATNDFENGWVLTFELPDGKDLDWMYIDFTVEVAKNDKGAYESDFPFESVQVHKSECYPTPPFELNNTDFKKAFKQSVKKFGENEIKDSDGVTPPEKWLEMISNNLTNKKNT